MKNCLILYFSGTNNTKFVALEFKEYLLKKNINVALFDIMDYKPDDKKYDFLIIGGPIYADLFPITFLEKLRNLNFSNIPTILFATLAANKVNAAYQDVINLKNTNGINVKYIKHFSMPNNFYNFMFKKTSTGTKKQQKINSTKTVKKVIDEFLINKINLQKCNVLRRLFSKLAYFGFYKFYSPFILKNITIDKAKCIKCKLCENKCPTKSVDIEADNCIKKSCVLCQKCLNMCPKNAFLYKNQPISQYKL